MKKVILVAAGVFIFLVLLVSLLHFGPPSIKAGEDRVLGAMILTNGSRLFLVTHRTGELIDAYETSLFRVDQQTNVFVMWLGYEDGYWWWGSLLADVSPDKVRIDALGKTLGVYSVSADSVTWLEGRKKIIDSYKIDGIKIQEPIPKAILKTK